MGTIGHTYGSEWHLLRYLGYHRDVLNRAIETAIPDSTVIDWSGFGFETSPLAIDRPPPRFLDREFEGLNFLTKHEQAQLMHAMADFWPTTGGLPNWDAVGRIRLANEESWLLVEAKSHLAELRSSCGARPESQGGGRDKILRAFQQIQTGLGINVGPEAWMGPFYQFCNRIAFLQFLTDQGIPTRLLFLYFLGDRFPATQSAACPGTVDGWTDALEEMYRQTGWGTKHPLGCRVHKAFVPVCPVEGKTNGSEPTDR